MTMRIFLAGLLGALAMFLWSFIAHMFLPLGEAGIDEIPNEPAVLSAMQSSLAAKEGLYLFPGTGLPPDASREQHAAAMERMDGEYAQKPSGLLVY
ncbi:MAG: hypothetical protein ABR589_09105, partial [Chthoniobacterales bacterium]